MSARAQESSLEEAPFQEGTTAEATPSVQTAPAPPTTGDRGRFRFGINGSGGLERVSANGASASGAMFGMDLRLGWQLSHLLAVYFQPHLSFGSLEADGSGAKVTGFTGTFIGTVLAEATFLDRFFAGAGVGYGVFNNPSGFAIDLRAGGYPLMGRSERGPRRKGLMLGMDFRTVFLDGATGIHFTGGLGYEAF
ncbi:MAG TPA: hypothetical protein VI299_15780 [Polyangiales bacterium]